MYVRERLVEQVSDVNMWIVTAKCLLMIGGTGMSLVCGGNRSRRRMTEMSQPESGVNFCPVHWCHFGAAVGGFMSFYVNVRVSLYGSIVPLMCSVRQLLLRQMRLQQATKAGFCWGLYCADPFGLVSFRSSDQPWQTHDVVMYTPTEVIFGTRVGDLSRLFRHCGDYCYQHLSRSVQMPGVDCCDPVSLWCLLRSVNRNARMLLSRSRKCGLTISDEVFGNQMHRRVCKYAK